MPVAKINYQINPGGKLIGKIRVPGDKSISHRALMLGALAKGVTHISGFLQGEDTLATMRAFQSLGVEISHTGEQVEVHGVGLHGLTAPTAPLDLGNSGTSARLMSGLLSAQAFNSIIIGDESLMKRPMRRVTEPLKLMHANIECSEDGTLPIHITGGQTIEPIDYRLPVVSAQLKSCLLLAGLYAQGKTRLHESVQTRDHTERMLYYFGVPIEQTEESVSITGGHELEATDIEIPGDISSAAFFIVGATIAEGSDLIIDNVGVNPTRDAVIHILQQMGANIIVNNQQVRSGEPVADLHIRSSKLHGIDIPINLVPIAIDEIPVLMVAAAFAEGNTRLHGAAELRVKESDRIESVAAGLRTLGIEVHIHEDGMDVVGGKVNGGIVDSFSDHRVAMAFAMAGLGSTSSITVTDCANVNTSFPGFVELAAKTGLDITSIYQ